ncbi:RING finger protein 37 [Polymixia lowei]
MVMNICLPHFQTTVHCNKLCADGYDVTNLLSADPAVRRRGFKLEYFLRPPVQVTLTFGFQVEVCRVDVELWPWGMDRGQACKRLEISTSSDPVPPQTPGLDQGHMQNQGKGQPWNDQSQEKQQQHDDRSGQCNGHQWSLQAQQWGAQALGETQPRGHAYRRTQQHGQSNTETSHPEPEFKLVGRCELREETLVCFSNTHYRPRPHFPNVPPPPKPADCRQEELWSRGLLSLGSVRQLRVTVPFGGAASALGLKALAVWGLPARCCPAAEVEKVRRAHEASQRRLPRPRFFAPSASQQTLPKETSPSSLSVPEEFLDPITLEVMTLPMLLPSGVSVDSTTLEEHQKREATWGRPPNDPFTGVPFTAASQPLPNPHLKSRVDQFLLRTGLGLRDGALGRQGEGGNPHPSRLLAPKVEAESQYSLGPNGGADGHTAQCDIGLGKKKRTMQIVDAGSGNEEENGESTSNPQPERSGDGPRTTSDSDFSRRNKRGLSGNPRKPISPTETFSVSSRHADRQPLPEPKRPRTGALSAPSGSSHEQRLSASLDEALFSALQGRPSFISNASQQRRVSTDKEAPLTSEHSQTTAAPGPSADDKRCSACSCSLSAYSTSTLSVYRLPCGHLLCRTCLHRKSRPLDSITIATPSHILCPSCQSPAPCGDITRVHH